MRKFALLVSVATGALLAYRLVKVSEAVDNGALENVGDTVTSAANDAADFVGDIVGTIKNNLFGTPYDDLINTAAINNGLPPEVLYKLLYQESRFRPDIIEGRTRSRTGALGIAQFMPATAVQWCGSVENALNPGIAIPAAARYLAWLRQQFGGDIVKAVAAYNWGIGNVQRKGLAKAPAETVNYALAITGVNINA